MSVQADTRTGAPAPLATTLQMSCQPIADEVIELAKRPAGVAQPRIIRPAPPMAVQPSHQFWQWRMTLLRADQPSQRLPFPLQRLARGSQAPRSAARRPAPSDLAPSVSPTAASCPRPWEYTPAAPPGHGRSSPSGSVPLRFPARRRSVRGSLRPRPVRQRCAVPQPKPLPAPLSDTPTRRDCRSDTAYGFRSGVAVARHDRGPPKFRAVLSARAVSIPPRSPLGALDRGFPSSAGFAIFGRLATPVVA